MNGVVTIGNRTSAGIQVGDRVVPAHGSFRVSYAEFVELARDGELERDGLSLAGAGVGRSRVSVADFGAVGDGMSDDTLSVQLAVDYVIASGGGTVVVPAGVFLVSGISIHGDVSVVGESGTHSVLRRKSDAVGSLIAIENSDSVSITSVRLVV